MESHSMYCVFAWPLIILFLYFRYQALWEQEPPFTVPSSSWPPTSLCSEQPLNHLLDWNQTFMTLWQSFSLVAKSSHRVKGLNFPWHLCRFLVSSFSSVKKNKALVSTRGPHLRKALGFHQVLNLSHRFLTQGRSYGINVMLYSLLCSYMHLGTVVSNYKSSICSPSLPSLLPGAFILSLPGPVKLTLLS